MVVTIVADPAGLEKGLDEATQKVKGLAGNMGRAIGLVGGTLTKGFSGEIKSASDAIGQLSQYMAFLPGPAGAIGSAVLGTLGTVSTVVTGMFDLINRKAEVARERA